MDTSLKKIWTKENPILKTWKKIKSLTAPSTAATLWKSKSWHCTAPPSPRHDSIDNNNNDKQTRKKKKTQAMTTVVAPEGCFTVYVGPKKERFVVKTELLNHPLFKILLDDAETEYGYRSEGPIVLPCKVDFFFKVLAEMESCDGDGDGDDDEWANPPVCGLCSPYRYGGASTDSGAVRRYSSYKLLKSPTVFKLNRF